MRRHGPLVAKLLGLLCGLLAVAVLLGEGIDTWDVRVNEVRVPIPRLPQDLEGLRIAVLADLHVNPRQPEGYLAQALALARGARPDMIVMPGDFISFDWRYLRDVRGLLSELSAPLGVYACLGNHDWFAGRGPHVQQTLEEAGVRVLTDEAIPLPQHPGSWLVGLDVYGPGRGDLSEALEPVAQDDFRIVLSHTPDSVVAASQLGIDLVVCGHTHGGQVCLPLLGALIVPSDQGLRYPSGLFDVDGTRLYVTRGVGSHANTMRFRCPPEVSLLVLTRGDRRLATGRWGIDLKQAANEFRLLRTDLLRLLRLLRRG